MKQTVLEYIPHTALRCLFIVAAAVMLAQLSAATASERTRSAPLRFSIAEGHTHNEFLRDRDIAAHLVATDGSEPRLVFAFPAGNSGAALWFEAPSGSISWLPGPVLAPIEQGFAAGTLRGVSAELEARGSPITIRQAVTSSIRVIRDYGYTGRIPPEVVAVPETTGNEVVWRRQRLDGGPGYYLSLEVLTGTLRGGGKPPLELRPDRKGRLRLRVTALTGDAPLTPIPEDELLTAAAQPDARLRNILAFLSYEEKLLAGSWRFDTYFGRDTLMTLLLSMPALRPGPVEAGLAAVLERLNAAGEVAHEEDIGEYAVLRHLAQGDGASDAPIYDYKMIDDDFLLAIVAAKYLLDPAAGSRRAADFLARRTASGETYGAQLVRNFRFVMSAASAFARNSEWQNLIPLKPGQHVGNWRDSEDGLGGGRFPYDVNGAFVPAALAAIERFRDSGVLEPYLPPRTVLAHASRFADTWRRRAPAFFAVTLPPEAAREEVARYARRIGVRPDAALSALAQTPLTFHAVALDGAGAPVPILSSDEGLALLLLDIPAQRVERIVTTLMRPFPAGLMTDVGLVVANPAYADDRLEPAFGRSRYHGTVVWSWQQAVLAAGLARQLRRDDLAPSTCTALVRARERLESALTRTHDVRGSELWSWSEHDGRYAVQPFGQRTEDVTESNAAQLWSTVHLYSPYEQLAGADEVSCVDRAAGGEENGRSDRLLSSRRAPTSTPRRRTAPSSHRAGARSGRTASGVRIPESAR